MTKSTFLLRRLAISLVAFVFVAGLCASSAQAVQHSLSGNGRSQIGNGLPIPIGFSAVPNGKIKAINGAIADVGTGPDPKSLLVGAGQLKYGTVLYSGGGAPTGFKAPKQTIGVIKANPAVFQVATQIAISGGGISYPSPHSRWKAGGRTGASTVAFCAGQTVPSGGDPGCIGPAGGSGINGILRYTKTAAQFGGPGQSRVAGVADVAIVGGAMATVPGTVSVVFAFANPAASGAQGAPFGWTNMTAGSAPAPLSGFGLFKANAGGTLTAPVLPSLGPGLKNPATSFGGPWTTGMLTVQVTAATPSETFVFSGSDNRVNGEGNISLVAGSVSARLLSGPNANRGWTTLTIGPKVVQNAPSMSSHGLAAVFGLLALAGGYVLQRRRTHS